MAIKISGDTVISDAKDVLNVVNGNYTGIVTASSYVGDGSSLTNVATTTRAFFLRT